MTTHEETSPMLPTPRHRPYRAILAAALLALLLATSAANAGQYTVTGTCGQWAPWGTGTNYVAIYPACPDLYARNVGGSFTTPAGVGGGWRFDAPAGTSVIAVELSGNLQGLNGWQAAAYSEGLGARELVNCPGVSCPGASTPFAGTYPTYTASAIVLRVRCGRTAGCPNNALNGQIFVRNANVTLYDQTHPTAALAGGTLLGGGWKRGTHTLLVDGSDNTGIQSARAVIDGQVVATAPRPCAYGGRMPCSNGRTALTVPVGGLADGVHNLRAEVVDGTGNVTGTPLTTIHIDNTPPTQPLDVTLTGGPGWRATNSFVLEWRNPAQTHAPVAGAAYRLCPSVSATADRATRDRAQARCTTGTRSGARLTRLGLTVPSPGMWNAQIWLIDAAGNQQPASAVEVNGLGYDPTPPAGVAFTSPDPRDPTRVHVRVADAVSGIKTGSIEVRRDGQAAWQPLPTQVTPGGLSAVVDDETLVKGLYYLRARAVDAAGLEASNDRLADGNPATIKLPIRLASTLTAGRLGKRTCKGSGARRQCRQPLATAPTVRIGHATRLAGRLTVAGQTMPGAPVEIWQRVQLDGAEWERIATLTTSSTGDFAYTARRGPARQVRFRYPGTPTIRPRNRDVQLRVPAAATLRPSRRTAINGETITFRGRVKGGWLPPSGALVELQVRTRGQWRTFAQPRASARTGRYAYQYRFETVKGRASFKFRARIRRQPGLPFNTGTSPATRVTVHGL